MIETENGLFELDERELRRFGYRIVNHIVDHHLSMEAKPVSRLGEWDDIERELRLPFSEEGEDPEKLLDCMVHQVLCRSMLSNHPRFLGFIPSPANPVTPFIEALVAAYNPFMGAWAEASGPTMIELNVLDWVGGLIGFPKGCGGQITSGGTAANLIGLAAARHHHLTGTSLGLGRVYLSTHTHSTIRRNLRLLGLGPEQVHVVETDQNGRMDPASLGSCIAEDRIKGLQPFCCVGTAGTTNTGAVDPLVKLADICRDEGLWFHVDAAFGGASLLTREGRSLLRGIERADTVVIDGHKWLFQPFELGIVVARDVSRLKAFFQMEAHYTDDLESALKLSDYGLQLSRSFKALKLWFSLRLFGQGAFRKAVENGLESTRNFEKLLRNHPRWEVVTSASLAVVTFRHRELDDEGHQKLVQACWRSGKLVLSSTLLDKRVVLRVCPIHPSLTQEKLEEILTALDQLAEFTLKSYPSTNASDVRERTHESHASTGTHEK